MFRIIFASLISIMAVSCSGPRYIDYFPYHDDGTPKPKVVLMPIYVADCVEPKNIDEELSDGIYYQLMNSGEFYVPSLYEIGISKDNLEKINIFSCDLNNISGFSNTDFLVGMEVIEHSISNVKSTNCQLSMRVRIKIVDIRCQTPKIVLYEIFKTCYTLSDSNVNFDFCGVPRGQQGYENTPYGLAHERLIRNLTARLEEVIWSAK